MSAVGTYLLRCLRTALGMHEEQLAMFIEYSSTFPPETVARWRGAVEEWYEDPSSAPDPFEEPTTRKPPSSLHGTTS